MTQVEKSVLSRIVSTLEAEGYLRKTPNGQLFLTVRYPAAAVRYLERGGFLQIVLPVLQQLADETGGLIQIALSDGGLPIYLAKAMGSYRLQARPLIGTEAVPHASAAGKLWMSFLDEFDLMAFIRDIKPSALTEATKTERAEILADIRKVQKDGYAVIDAELSEDVSALGVPLIGENKKFLGALCLSMPTYRAADGAILKHLPVLRRYAADLASLIQYQKPLNEPALHERSPLHAE